MFEGVGGGGGGLSYEGAWLDSRQRIKIKRRTEMIMMMVQALFVPLLVNRECQGGKGGGEGGGAAEIFDLLTS